MRLWLAQLDELLRGDRTRADQLTSGNLNLPLRIFVPAAAALGGAYGFFMGWYALASGGEDGWKQMISSTVKLPALFLFTLLVTFPSLYVFNALAGSRLTFQSTLRLLVAAIVINLAVGASLGPIVGFFTLSTDSYAFMVLLNVAVLALAGAIALGFLLRTLRRMVRTQRPINSPPPAPPRRVVPADYTGEAPPPLTPRGAEPDEAEVAAMRVFRIWVLIYGLVGAQMSWVLRPFIGAPGSDFALFRTREGNFFASVWDTARHLLGW